MTNWQNVLLTDSGFYYDNELDKPLTPLINHLQSILAKPFSEAKVLFIPTAAMQDPGKAAAGTKRLRNELLQMGFQPNNITIHDIDGNLSEAKAMTYDAIYLTGGSTRYLAKRVREADFAKIIIKMVHANKAYIGQSAGSCLAMASFDIDVDDYPGKNPQDFIGLGLINAYFSVHCKPGTPNRTHLPLPHIAMQCNQAIAVTSEGYKLIEGAKEYE